MWYQQLKLRTIFWFPTSTCLWTHPNGRQVTKSKYSARLQKQSNMNAMFETRSRKWKHCHDSGSSTLSLLPLESDLWNKGTSLSSSPPSLCTVYQTLLSFILPSLPFLSSLNGKYRSSMICPLASWSVMRKLHLVSPAILKEAFGCSRSQIQLYVVKREREKERVRAYRRGSIGRTDEAAFPV